MAEKGFTLVEILITIAVLGILLAIAAMSAGDMLDRYKVQGQTKQLYSDLMNARVSAMQRNRIFFVTLAANQYAIYEDVYSAAAGAITPDGDGILQPVTGQDRLATQTTTLYALASSPPITGFAFAQNGLVTLATTTVDIRSISTSNAASDCIELSSTRILMGKWNGTTCIVQ